MDKKKSFSKKTKKYSSPKKVQNDNPIDFDSDASDSSTSSLMEKIAGGKNVIQKAVAIEPSVPETIKIKKTIAQKNVTPQATQVSSPQEPKTPDQPVIFQTETDAIAALGAMAPADVSGLKQYSYVRYIKKMPEGTYRVYIKGGYIINVKINEAEPDKSYVVLTNNPTHYNNWIKSGGFDLKSRPSYSMPLNVTDFYRKMEPEEIDTLVTEYKNRICELENKNNILRNEIIEKEQAILVLQEELGHTSKQSKSKRR